MIQPNPRVLFQKLGTESVLLHLDSEQYFGLDAVGSRMWTLICEHQSIEQVVPKLLEEFDVDKMTLEKDLENLLSELLENGLLQNV